MVMESCPPREELAGAIMVETLVWGLIAVAVVFSSILDIFLLSHENTVKRIRKETELLEALKRDFDQLLKDIDSVKSRAHLFWDSEIDVAGIQLPIGDDENKWINSIPGLASQANDCVTNFKKQSRGVFYGYTAIFRVMPIIDVFCNIYHIKREIKKQLEEKDNPAIAKNIYQSMERSRKKTRSLLGQYTIQENNSGPIQQPKRRKPCRSIDDLMTKSKHLFSGKEGRWSIQLLLPLHAFLKDLRQLELETETEKYWKKEVEELVADAEELIGKFSQQVSTFSYIRSIWNKILIVSGMFEKEMEHIFTALDDLLKRKSRYGFDFTDTGADKSIFLSTHETTNANSIITTFSNIDSKLSKLEQSSKQVQEIDSLCNTLKKMHDELQTREETDGRNACLRQIKRIAEEIDHSLDNHWERYQIGPVLKHFEQIKKGVDRLQQIINLCNIKRQKSTSVVGVKDDIRELVSKLTATGDDHSILPIVGMMGVGKTTVANAIYHNKTIAKHFPIRFWVKLTQEAILKSEVLLMKEDGSKNPSLYVTQLRDHLKDKLSLVVLDNVSKTEDWDTLKPLLSGMTNGSRIVLTTRFKNVALHAIAPRSSIPYRPRLLTKEDSWKLFQMVTSNPDLNKKEAKLAMKVVGRCGGLPLAILSLGWLVSANGISEKPLLWALERINQGQNQTPWLHAWGKHSEEFNKTERNCLSCFTLFPIDYEIPARRLVTLWVAEGLIKFDDKKEIPEDVAERYLEKLRDCNMIQAVELKCNGKIKTCRLPGALREFIVHNCNRTSGSQYSITTLESQFAYNFDDRGLDANLANVFRKNGLPLSVLFFDKREGNKPGEHIGNIISEGITSGQFMEIRVLDLERVFRPHLPHTLSRLIHLKYLGLRWTYLEAIPPFIGKLLNLETLDVKHTCIHILPSSIFKLKKLRNLYLNQSYRSKLEGKLHGNFHENLQTLWGVYIQQSSPLLLGLHLLKNLRNLKLAFQLTETEQDTLVKLIVQLSQLQSLRLRSIDEMGEPQHLKLNNMSKLEKLESLHLFGKLEGRLRVSRLPQSLTDLTISASELSADPMQELKSLTKLKTLSFYAESYTGNCMVSSKDSFPQLRVLRFWKLKKLKKWDVNEGAMPNLMELEIRSCSKLKVLSGLNHLKNLHRIKPHDMPDEFMKEVKKMDVEIVEV